MPVYQNPADCLSCVFSVLCIERLGFVSVTVLFVSVVKSPIYDEPYLLHYLQESGLSDILEAMLSLASSKVVSSF